LSISSLLPSVLTSVLTVTVPVVAAAAALIAILVDIIMGFPLADFIVAMVAGGIVTALAPIYI
jgi:hypothetical protein